MSPIDFPKIRFAVTPLYPVLRRDKQILGQYGVDPDQIELRQTQLQLNSLCIFLPQHNWHQETASLDASVCIYPKSQHIKSFESIEPLT